MSTKCKEIIMKIDIEADVNSWDLAYAISSRIEDTGVLNTFIETVKTTILDNIQQEILKRLDQNLSSFINDRLNDSFKTAVDNYINCPVFGCKLKQMVEQHVESRLPSIVKNVTESRLTKIVEKLKNE